MAGVITEDYGRRPRPRWSPRRIRPGRRATRLATVAALVVATATLPYSMPAIRDVMTRPYQVGVVTAEDLISPDVLPDMIGFSPDSGTTRVLFAERDRSRLPQPRGSGWRDDVLLCDFDGDLNWAIGHGRVPADRGAAAVRLSAGSNESVELTGVSIRVLKRNPPPVASVISCSGRSHELGTRTVTVDLDPAEPVVRAVGLNGRGPVNVTLTRGQSVVIDLIAQSSTCDCEWEAVLHLRVDGRDTEQIVRNGREPFRTTSSTNSTIYHWSGDGWALGEADDG